MGEEIQALVLKGEKMEEMKENGHTQTPKGENLEEKKENGQSQTTKGGLRTMPAIFGILFLLLIYFSSFSYYVSILNCIFYFTNLWDYVGIFLTVYLFLFISHCS